MGLSHHIVVHNRGSVSRKRFHHTAILNVNTPYVGDLRRRVIHNITFKMYTYRIATGLAEAELHPGLSYYHCVTRQKVICTVCTYIYYAACTREGCRVTSCTYCRRRWPRPETFYSVRVIFQEHNGNPLTVIMERSCARARALAPFDPLNDFAFVKNPRVALGWCVPDGGGGPPGRVPEQYINICVVWWLKQ